MFDILEDSPSGPNFGFQILQNDKKIPIDMVRIGSGSQYGKNTITVPPNSFNPQCIRSRTELPIFNHRQKILDLVNSNQVVIIESSTGSGKSTQVPQFILEQATSRNKPCRVIVAEPKRICATTLATRVSFERGEMIGGTVGYQIRLEAKVSPNSNLIYVTNGVILRMLMSGRPEEFFHDITALIIDEVHERDAFSDFLLLCIREYLSLNPNLKLIIMSATVQTEIFSQYFGGCPVLKLEGRAFPVQEHYLEDILKLLKVNNPKIEELNKNFAVNPEMFQNTKKALDENLDDDTKDEVNDILGRMSYSNDLDREFYHFFYMVQAEQVPVDFQHNRNKKTALMFAVEYELEEKVSKLLDLKADPILKLKIDGNEITPLEKAEEMKNEVILGILKNHLEMKNTPNQPKSNEIESSPFDRQLLDLYYDTLIHPGVNRGVFLEDIIDLNLIVNLVQHLHFNTAKENGILIFLPGHDEIFQLANLLCNVLDINYNIFILHSQMNISDQTSVFDTMPEGIRKIIIATNIAESSITVNDVVSSLNYAKLILFLTYFSQVYVIDSGKEKLKCFNSVTHVSSLQVHWISKASAKQRSGRAGRLRNGFVFRIYSRDRYNYLIETQKPDFLRCDLTDICLQAKMIVISGETISDFMKKAISPPSELSVQHSIKILHQLGALREDESLTQLGFYLADIPLNAKYGKMLIYAIFFKCIDPILTLVSILSINDPFTLPHRQEDRERLHKVKRGLEDNSFSDHFVLLKIFQKWNEYKTSNEFDDGFCEDNFVNPGTMERVQSTRHKIVSYLRSIRLIRSVGNLTVLNEYSRNWSIIKLCIAAGSYPEVARILKRTGEIITPIESKLIINPGSIMRQNFNMKMAKDLSQLPSEWMFFDEKNLIGGFGMARVCTLASNLCIALTAGHGLRINDEFWSEDGETQTVELQVDKFIKFSADSTTAYILQEIRYRIMILMTQFLMNTDKFVFKENDEILIGAVVKILELEDEAAGFKIQHDGINSRPRIVTRSYNGSKQNFPLDTIDTNKKESVQKVPPASQQKGVGIGSSHESVNHVLPKLNTMRYFMVEIRSDVSVKTLNSKSIVLMKTDAKLPDAFINALIEIEVNDRVTKKAMVFYSGMEIVGAGMLLDCRERQMNSDIMKMFFQSKQRFNITQLK